MSPFKCGSLSTLLATSGHSPIQGNQMENLRPFLNVNPANQIYRHNRRNYLMMTYSRGGKEQVLRPSGLNVLRTPGCNDSKLLNQYWFNSRFISVNSILTVVTALFISLISPTSVLFPFLLLWRGISRLNPGKGHHAGEYIYT